MIFVMFVDFNVLFLILVMVRLCIVSMYCLIENKMCCVLKFCLVISIEFFCIVMYFGIFLCFLYLLGIVVFLFRWIGGSNFSWF